MRLIHTADVHLDASFASFGVSPGFGNRRRQSLRDVFHSVVCRAREWPADALLIPGDLFDLERVSRDTVAFLRAEFEALDPVPVVIAPGNHDPYMTDSPYATESWPENVVIFTKPEWTPYALKDGQLVVHGFAFDGFDILSNPFGKLTIPDDGAVHVGVAHGCERGYQPPDGKSYAPFDAADAALDNLAYLALGHFHSVTCVEGDFKTCMYYSGAPEAHGFGQTGPRYYLEVEIADASVQVRRIPSAQVIYTTCAIDCTDLTTAQQVIDAIRSHVNEDGPAQIVRITLGGFCLASVADEIRAIHDAASEAFERLVLVDDTLPLEDYEDLAREGTTLGMFIQKLNEEVEDAPDEAQRRMVERAREVGLAAYRGQELIIRGLEAEGD